MHIQSLGDDVNVLVWRVVMYNCALVGCNKNNTGNYSFYFNNEIYYMVTFIYSQISQHSRVTFYGIVRFNGICNLKSNIIKIPCLDLNFLLP